MAEVRIDHRALHDVNADLGDVASSIDAHIRTLRSEFQRLGVSTHNLDTVLRTQTTLDREVLPALRTREREAERVAGLPYSGALNDQLAATDLEVGGQPDQPADTSISALTGGGSTQPPPVQFVPCQAPEAPPEEPPLFSLGGLKKLGGDIVGGIKDGAEWLAGKISEAWDTLAEEVSKAWEAMATWWEETTAALGAWIDENLASVREWIKNNVIILRIIAIVLKVVGWVLVVVGAVLLILAVIASLTGIGALVGVPSAGVALAILGIGASLVGAGEMVDTVADWGEGKIDGKELVKRLAVEGAFTLVTALIPGGAFLRLGKKLLDKLPASLGRKITDFLERLFKKDPPVEPGVPGRQGDVPGSGRPLRGGSSPDDPIDYTYTHPGFDLQGMTPPTRSELARIGSDPRKYDKFSREWAIASYNRRLEELARAGKPPESFDTWFDRAYRNWGNDPRGKAFEEEFWRRHDFSTDDGWKNQVDGRPTLDTPFGPRKYDVYHEQGKIAYEIKSGDSIVQREFDIDRQMAAQGWEVVYVFGKPPSPAVMDRLTRAGIKVEVWHSIATPTG